MTRVLTPPNRCNGRQRGQFLLPNRIPPSYLLHMRYKLLTLLSLIGFAGVCVVNAQSPTPAESPAASASPAKHRTHKKAETSPSPATENTASPAATARRTRKKTEASPSPAAETSASPTAHRKGKKAEASPAPAASATPQNPISAIGSLVKPKASATPTTQGAETKATAAPGGGHGLVWVNTETHIYHKEGSRFYGTTKKGKYMSEADALKEGDRAAKKGE